MEQNKRVLVSGASFAGLTTAYWMNNLGYKVTVVETGNHLKMGGTPVDIKDSVVDIVKRMGLLEKIKANRLSLEKWEFKNSNDVTEHTFLLEQFPDNEFEIERDVLLNMLFELIKNNVNFIFNNSITSLQEKENYVDVIFKDGSQQTYDLVFGCDGIHSVLRKIWFGKEMDYANSLGQYFSIAIVNKLLIEENTLHLYAEPNKSIMLNAYNGKTDVVFIFRPNEEIPYDFRNQAEQKEIVWKQMQGMNWRASELQNELLGSQNFFFDKFCQIKMPSWTKRKSCIGRGCWLLCFTSSRHGWFIGYYWCYCIS